MFFESPSEIVKIAGRTGCAVFVMPDKARLEIPGALILQPEDKTVVTIEQVRELIARLAVKQVAEQYVVIRPAEALGEEAANALLKTLEEPKEKVHFVLVTSEPSRLLPTVLSRSAVYFLKQRKMLASGIATEEKIKDLAKRLMVAKPADLPGLAEEIVKKKDGVRAYALSILATVIEMLYKTYFITEKEVFVKKLPKFLAAYENIDRNGHIKLHLVADLC